MRIRKSIVYSDEGKVRTNLPARLNAETAAAILGFALHDIQILCRAKLLTPLGRPAANAPKYFARVEIEQLAIDIEWLNRASIETSKYWRRKRETSKESQLPDADIER